MKTKIQELLSHKPSMTNFGRSLQVNQHDVYSWVMGHPGDSFNEKLYCIVNNIIPPVCPASGEKLKFINYTKGYRKPKIVKVEEPTIKDIFNDHLVELASMVGSSDIERGRLINRFIKRNENRNSSLYDLPDTEEGYSFITCPILHVRMSMIKRTYVENVLGMSMNEFIETYPEQLLVCKKRSENIKDGLSVVDETGKTKHQISVEKSIISRNVVGDDGLTVNQRKGLKTKKTHLENVDENGLNGYQRLAQYRNLTILDNGLSIQQNAYLKREPKSISRASIRSSIILQPVLQWLCDNNFKYYFDEDEYVITVGSRHYFYDLVIPDLNMCIEYQSKEFHPYFALSDDEWNSWSMPFDDNVSANDKLKYDFDKARSLWKERNIQTWFVWEKTQESDVETILTYLGEINEFC